MDKQGVKFKNSIVEITQELERWYHIINNELYSNQLDQNVRIMIQTKGRIKKAIGFFAPKRWRDDINNCFVSELTLCAEDLNRHNPVEIMLHEMVHNFNNQNGVKDCCSNQYHNRKFKEVAEGHGLEVKQDKTYGFCFTSLNDKGKEIEKNLSPNMELFQLHRMDGPKQYTYLRKFVCDCGMIVRVAKVNEFSATCDICHTKFRLAD